MPAIMPISDLRNYTDVLKEVDINNRVYLTRNGRGAYTIMTIEEADELDRLRALHSVISDLEKGKPTAELGKAIFLANVLGLDIEIKQR